VPGYVTIAVELEIEPGALVARHTHPGVESTYFISGSGELLVDGQPAKPFTAGDAVQISPGTIHSVRNGPTTTKGIGTYIVEKDKPLASAASERHSSLGNGQPGRRDQQFLRIVGRPKAIRPAGEVALGQRRGRHVAGVLEA
jgi:quercetin dioxygenase-like cupin family protein